MIDNDSLFKTAMHLTLASEMLGYLDQTNDNTAWIARGTHHLGITEECSQV